MNPNKRSYDCKLVKLKAGIHKVKNSGLADKINKYNK